MNSALFDAIMGKSTAAPIATAAGDPGDPGDPGTPVTPKPKFKDDKEKEAYWRNTVRKKYGDHLAQRMQWMDWAEQKLPSGVTPLELATKHAKGRSLDPEYLLSSAMEEGIGLRFPGKDGGYYDQGKGYEAANKNGELKGYDVDGYAPYGLDTIGDRVNDLIKGGYLPKDFASKMKAYKTTNEQGGKVTTAAFKDDDAAMEAKAAIMAEERDNFNKYVKAKGVTLSPEAQKFWMLAAYNGGAGKAQKMFEEYAKRGLIKDDAFLKTKPANDNFGQIYNNVMPRLSGGKFYRGEGFFDQQAEAQQKPPAMPAQSNSLQKAVKGYKQNADGDLVAVYK